MESDRIRPVCIHQNAFSILAPRMGSDPSNFVLHDLFLFQFSLPVWGATKSICTSKAPFYFSILAPRMESDSRRGRLQQSISLFNSRSSHGERPAYSSLFCTDLNFQFTLPAWRATGEPIVDVSAFIFSIHAPRMESDSCCHPA